MVTDVQWVTAGATLAYAVFTLGVLIVLTAAALYAKGQLKEATRARLLEAINQIHHYLDSEETRAARDYVSHAKPAELTQPGADDGKIRTVANTFEYIGLLAEHSLVAKAIILDYFWELVVVLWSRLKPYVETTRKRRGDQYAGHFERLAKDAEDYCKRKYPDYKVDTQPSAP